VERRHYGSVQDLCGIALRNEGKRKRKNERKHPQINVELCTSCGVCAKLCPYQAMALKEGKIVVYPEQCLSCGLCASVCPHQSIRLGD